MKPEFPTEGTWVNHGARNPAGIEWMWLNSAPGRNGVYVNVAIAGPNFSDPRYALHAPLFRVPLLSKLGGSLDPMSYFGVTVTLSLPDGTPVEVRDFRDSSRESAVRVDPLKIWVGGSTLENLGAVDLPLFEVRLDISDPLSRVKVRGVLRYVGLAKPWKYKTGRYFGMNQEWPMLHCAVLGSLRVTLANGTVHEGVEVDSTGYVEHVTGRVDQAGGIDRAYWGKVVFGRDAYVFAKITTTPPDAPGEKEIVFAMREGVLPFEDAADVCVTLSDSTLDTPIVGAAGPAFARTIRTRWTSPEGETHVLDFTAERSLHRLAYYHLCSGEGVLTTTDVRGHVVEVRNGQGVADLSEFGAMRTTLTEEAMSRLRNILTGAIGGP